MSSSIRIPPHAVLWWLYLGCLHLHELHLLLWWYAIQARRDHLQACTRSETIALTAAHLHQGSRSLLWEAATPFSETGPRLLQKKEDTVTQITLLSHFHAHFYLRKENWGIFALHPLASPSWGGGGSPLTLSETRKTQSENGQKNNALMQCSWDL